MTIPQVTEAKQWLESQRNKATDGNSGELTGDAARKAKECQQNNYSSCNSLGYMYRDGKGVTKDYGKAMKLYEKACDGGIARGCDNLGYMYRHGKGVTKDRRKAKKLYKKACDLGYTEACNK